MKNSWYCTIYVNHCGYDITQFCRQKLGISAKNLFVLSINGMIMSLICNILSVKGLGLVKVAFINQDLYNDTTSCYLN